MKDIITSTSNPRIVEARKLTHKKHRHRSNRFAAEGLQILRMAIEGMACPRMAGHIRPIDVFSCEYLFTTDTAPSILAQLVAAGANKIPVSQQVIEALSDRVLSQGLVATFAIDSLLHSLEELHVPSDEGPQLFVVLDRPQYPGNVGTLIRTANAVGADGMILIEPSADAFDPKSVRSSMGSIFATPIARTGDIAALDDWAGSADLRWVGAAVSDGDLIWDSEAMSGSIGLILGNEGEGVQPELRLLVDRTVRLPQRGSADSLNVSIAGGVLMYEWVRVNRPDIY